MSFVKVMEELKKMMGGSPLGSRVWGWGVRKIGIEVGI